MRTNIRVNLADSLNKHDTDTALALGLLVLITNGIGQMTRLGNEYIVWILYASDAADETHCRGIKVSCDVHKTE